MDPLSLASGIAGLVALADLVFSRTFAYTKAVHGAGGEIAKLTSEVGSLSGTLHSLDLLVTQLEEENFETNIRIGNINACQKTLERIDKKLGTTTGPNARVTRTPNFMQKLKWPFSASEVKELLAEIERHKSTFTLALTATNMSTLVQCLSKGMAEDIQEIKVELKRRRTFETRIALDKERQIILDFFGSVDPTSHHKRSLKARYPSTGVWFTEGEDFQKWLGQDDSHAKMWLYGIPGAGKTVLVASAIEDVINQSNEEKAVAFFYCDYNDPQRQDPVHILGSLAAQLARQDERAFDAMQALYATCTPKGAGKPIPPDPEDLVKLISEISTFFQTVSIIVDALDECDTNIANVVELLVRLGESGNIKTLFVSRPDTTIQGILQEEYTQVSIAAQSDDIKLYVAAELELRIRKRTLRIRNSELKDHIMETLVSKAQGMFRWVACQMDYICGLATDADRRKALNELPPTLNSTYERILERVNVRGPRVQHLVQNALRWIVCSRGHLTIDELCEALAVSNETDYLNYDARPDEEEILSCCSSLLRRSTDSRGLELAHFTCKEFLTTIAPDNPLSAYRIETEEAEIVLAKTCLTYLCLKDFGTDLPIYAEDYNERSDKYCFFNHATMFWHEYVSSQSHWEDLELVALTKRLFNPSKTLNFLSWAQAFCWLSSLKEDEGPSFGEASATATRKGVTPLHYAAMLGQTEVVTWLIESTRRGSVNLNSGFGTPLHCAILRVFAIKGTHNGLPEQVIEEARRNMDDRDRGLIELLLDAGADCKAYYRDYRGTRFSSLHLVVGTRGLQINSVALISRMLRSGATFDEDSMGLLRYRLEERLKASWDSRTNTGDASAMKQFLESTDNSGDTEAQLKSVFMDMALSADRATSSLSEGTRNRLNSKALDSHLELGNLLQQAASFDQIDVIQELLTKKSLSINYVDEETGETALHFAAANASVEAVQLLLDSGADFKIKDKRGRFPLHQCAFNRNADVLVTLIDKYEDRNATANMGRTVWHMAAARDNVEVIEALLDMDGDVQTAMKIRTDEGWTPTLMAAKSSAEGALSLLLNYCQDVHETANDGMGLVHFAAQNCTVKTMEKLIKKGADLSLKTQDGSTALHFLLHAQIFRLSVFDLLMKHNTPNTPGPHGQTPLHFAVGRNFPSIQTQFQVIERLMSPSTINLQDDMGRTPLHIFMQGIADDPYKGRILDLLLDNGADPTIKNFMDMTPTHLCWKSLKDIRDEKDSPEITEVFRLLYQLITHTTDSSSVNEVFDSRRPLGLAIEFLQEDIARLLLDRGACPNDRDKSEGEWASLDLACYYKTSTELFETMLDRAKSIKEMKKNGHGLPHICCLGRSAATPAHLQLLFDRGVDIEMPTAKTGMTPLMLAFRERNLAMSEFLLESGANLDAMNVRGMKPLHFAATGGFTDILPVLRERNIDFTSTVTLVTNGIKTGGMNILHIAAQNGHDDFIGYVLENNLGIAVDALNDYGETALHVAAAFGTTHCIKVLLDNGADLCYRQSKFGCNALHRTVLYNFLSTAKFLLEQGCPQIEDNTGHTPELLALQKGYGEMVDMLRLYAASKKGGVKIKQTREKALHQPYVRSISALSVAIEAGDLDLCKREVERGVSISAGLDGCDGCTPILVALSLKKLDVARYFMGIGAPTDGRTCGKFGDKDYSAIHLASSDDEALDILRSLLKATIPNEQQFVTFKTHPVHVAVLNDNVDGLRSLLEFYLPRRTAKLTPSPSEISLISQSESSSDSVAQDTLRTSEEGDPDSVNSNHNIEEKRIKESKTKVDRGSRTINAPTYLDFARDSLLTYPMASKQSSVLERKIYKFKYVWSKTRTLNNFSGTPLHLAAISKSVQCAKLLLEWGAVVNSRDETDKTPLHIAVWEEDTQMVELLLRNGANVHLRDSTLQTPVGLAVKKGNLAILKSLHERGGNLNAVDFGRKTLLEHSISADALDVARYLLDNGCDYCTTNRYGRTPVSYIFTEATSAMATLLMNYGLDLRRVILSGSNPLIFDNYHGRFAAVKRAVKLMPRDLLDGLLNPTKRQAETITLLYRASQHGNSKMIDLLLSHGADTEVEGGDEGTPLMVACAVGQIESVKKLVRSNAKISYVKDGKVMNALDAARHYPYIIHWFLVGRHTDQERLTDGSDAEDRPIRPWSGTVKVDLAEVNSFYKMDYGESMLDYIIDMRYAKQYDFKDHQVPQSYVEAAGIKPNFDNVS